MQKIFLRVFWALFFLAAAKISIAQPFINEIKAFKKQDSVSSPPRNAILFIGSSSFRKWVDVSDYFPGHQIINRGFGGSILPDLIRYEEDIIFPYQPKQIVIYCGDNDIASSDTVSAYHVLNRFKTLFADIKSKLPDVSVVYVSIKPSPSRWSMKNRMEKTNQLIRKFLKKKKNTGFVNVWKPMLGTDGKPNDALFLNDKLHMNTQGYELWQKFMAPYLLKD